MHRWLAKFHLTQKTKLVVFNKVLIKPDTDGNYQEDEGDKLPASGIVIESPADAPVKVGERVWFSYTAEKFQGNYLCAYEDLFVVDRKGLKALGSWRLIKWREKDRVGDYGDHDDLLTKETILDGKVTYFARQGRRLCVDHDHDGQEWYYIIDKNEPYVQF